MKHLIRRIAVLVLALVLVTSVPSAECSGISSPASESVSAASRGVKNASNGVKQNGWLSVKGTKLVNRRGKTVVLHGMSSHGMQWYSGFTSKNAIGATAAYGANVFRVAMYTEENGYLSNKKTMLKKVYSAMDAAIARNMYVIVDWHILSDGDPNAHVSAAKTFFKKVSKRYAKRANVLYEICNEPNGGTTWSEIKTYANKVIPVIRKNSPKSIVLVGTPNWSQDVDTAAKSPLKFKNVMYTCHFYAGTHGLWLRSKVKAALKAGAPVFVTEWGTSRADGGGGVYTKEAGRWISFMKKNKISWTNWSYCNKNESSAALTSKAKVSDGIKTGELTKSGRYVFSKF